MTWPYIVLTCVLAFGFGMLTVAVGAAAHQADEQRLVEAGHALLGELLHGDQDDLTDAVEGFRDALATYGWQP